MTENIDNIESKNIKLDTNIEKDVIQLIEGIFYRNKFERKISLANFLTNALIDCLATATSAAICAGAPDPELTIEIIIKIIRHKIQKILNDMDNMDKSKQGSH